MKKIKLFALAAFAMLSTNAFAVEPVTGNGAYNPFTYKWTKSADATPVYTATITGFVEGITPPTEITIPDTVKLTVTIGEETSQKEFAVTAIEKMAFKGAAITKITIDGGKDGKSGLTVINDSAFARCASLTTVDFSKAENLTTLGAGAFKYTKIGAFDLSKTKVATLPNDLFRNSAEDWSAAESVAYPTSVKLPAATFATLSNAFTGCTGLTAFEIPAKVTKIPAYAFSGCTNLETVTFAHKSQRKENGDVVEADPFYGIATYAFNGTKIASIEIPSWASVEAEAAAPIIAQAAFANCSSLKTFTYKPRTGNTGDNAYLNDEAIKIAHAKAFVGCSGVTFYTTAAVVTLYTEGETVTPPTNTTFSTDKPAPAPATGLKGIVYKSNDKKYFVKYQAPATEGAKDVLIDEKYGRVYAAYLDAGNYTLNMVQFKKKNGKYQIAAGDVVVILTDSALVKPEAAEAATNKGTSWLYKSGYVGDGISKYDETNNLKLTAAATTKADLELGMTDANVNAIYVWINNATKGVGFQKLGNITSIPKNTLYVYAKEPANGARLNVVWRDENGNIEDETTAIQSIESAKAQDGAIYNLQGVRVNAAKKGLYIQNGKKFIVK